MMFYNIFETAVLFYTLYFLPFLKSVSNAIIREFDEYLFHL